MNDRIQALIEEFNDQIRVAPKLVEKPERQSEKPGDHYGGLRIIDARHYGSRRAR